MSLLGATAALLGVLSGCLWRVPRFAAADRVWFERINRPDRLPILDPLWIALRPFGRTWFLLLAVGMGLAFGGAPWLSFAVTAGLLAVLEPLLKRAVRRVRPYLELPGANLRLRQAPTDHSFPSGDAGRAGLLAAAVCFAIAAPPWAGVLAAAMAALVAVGRVRAGVHYPFDVWAGAWLGFGLGTAWAGWFPFFVTHLT